MSKSLSDQLAEILGEFAQEVDDILITQEKKEAAAVAKDLRNTSPKMTGKYAKSWTYKKTETGFIVYNKQGWKTHLLENGHLTANGTKRVRAIKHIKPAEEKGIKELIDNIKKEIESL